MIVAIDAGNTETVIGLFEADALLDHWRIATDAPRTVDETGLLVRALIRESGYDVGAVRAAVIASVVPPFTTVLVETCERHLGLKARVIDARTELPIRLEVEEPLSVGADRIVNTLAAAALYRTDTIAVDLGTATTFDCITGDGVFVGGVIAPGVQSGAETLTRRTAKLPRVDLDLPGSVIGRRSETSIRSGVFYGAVELIDGIVRRIKAEWERPAALVVATGGLAPLIAPHCASVARVEPFLTLYGLELALRHLEERESGMRLASLKRPRTRRGR
jgi:type III pantothenate kinase